MATRRPASVTQDAAQKVLESFLQLQKDEANVRQLAQPLEVSLTGTNLYIPAPTRAVMDSNHGAPVMAIETKTHVAEKLVFFYPAADPDSPGARKLRTTESMGPANVAFGVPLQKLKLKFTVSRRIVLPVQSLDTPDQGTIYWISFADVEKEARDVDLEAIAAAKKAKAAAAKARKAARKTPPTTQNP